MDKRYLIIAGIFLFLISISLVSAWEFDNIKEVKGDTVKIYNSFLLPTLIKGELLADYKLTDNPACLIDCYAEGTAKLYYSGKLINSLKIYDTSKNELNRDVKFFILKNVSYEVSIPQFKELCTGLEKANEPCKTEVTDYRKETRYKDEWVEYSGEILPAGIYQWRIEGKRKINEEVDWVFTALGKEVNEWAWWNSTFDYKKKIEITENSGSDLSNYSVYLNITKEANMRDGYQDIRFVNGRGWRIKFDCCFCKTTN